MARVRVQCPNCGGEGILPPLGDKGDLKDVSRYFPRPCDTCNCSQFIYVEKEIREKIDDGYVTGHPDQGQTYVAGQGDC